MGRFGVDVSLGDESNSLNMPPTIADMALEVLKDPPQGLTANNILKSIQEKWKPELVRTSLSPPLSRLKEKTLIEYVESSACWRLPQKNEAPAREASIVDEVTALSNSNTTGETQTNQGSRPWDRSLDELMQ